MTTQQLDDATEKLEQLNTSHRLGLVSGITETRVALAELRTKLNALRQRVELAQGSRNPAQFGLAEGAKFTVTRKRGSNWETVPISFDTELQPGDALTVQLPPPPELGAGNQAATY